MKKNVLTFATPSSLATIAKILAFITEHGTVTGAQVREMTGLSEHYNGSFLRHMKDKDLIHVAARQIRHAKGSSPVLWAAGTAEDFEIETTDVERVVRVLKQWPQNLKRDPLHCYLFGMPGARAAA